MIIGVVKQSAAGETRAALTPGVVTRLAGQQLEVLVEPGAGAGAMHGDAEYEKAGAKISDDIWSQADIITTIAAPDEQQVGRLKPEAVVVGMIGPLKTMSAVKALAAARATTFSMEFLPRITRAQPMDVLSSQANIAGYKAVLLAADAGAKMYPMMMTAAGTIAPSRVFVIGAGVAGLQAIATAKRLGAIVEAYDVRPVVKEQVQSLGARFVELGLDTDDAQTAGGYAKQQTDDERKQQAELMARHVIGADAVITTAAVFGKAPPMLIPADVVSKMQRGAVLVDCAADADAGRGNCEATKPAQRYTTDNGVHIIGETNLPALVAVHASQAYASNMQAFIGEIIADGQLKIDLADEVQQGAAITHDGEIVNEMVKAAAG